MAWQTPQQPGLWLWCVSQNLKLPSGVAAETPFVQILDPATGTGTFLENVIEAIYETMSAKWRKEGRDIRAAWNEYVPKHLLPRLHGFEIMMASYAIAHVKLALALKLNGVMTFRAGSAYESI